MIPAMGAMKIHARNIIPVVSAVRPVRPPASTPEADSTKVVTVEVPVTEPARVPTASDKSACFMLGIFPSLSSIPARLAVPTRVPIVSNISMIQKVTIRVIAVNQPICAKPWKLNLNSVVDAISPKAGTKDAVAREAKGFVPRKMASPAQ